MSGRGRKQAGNGGSSSWSSSQQQQGQEHQVRQGSSFWECPGCGSAVHTALVAFHISSCPVVGGDEAFVPMNAKAKSLLGQERANKDSRDVRKTGQSSPAGRTELSPVSVSKGGKGDVAQQPAWAEEEKQEMREAEEEDEELQGGASSPSMEAAAGVGGAKAWDLDPETPIRDGRDRMAVSSQMSASPAALDDGGKREPAEARRKRLFEDWGQMLSPERELVVQLSPGGDDDASPAPSFPVDDDPQAKRSKVTEPFSAGEGMMVIDLGLIDSGSDGDDVGDEETLPYVSRIQDSQQERTEEVEVEVEEESVAQQAPDHTQTIPAELGEAQQELRGDDNRSPETVAEIQKGEGLGDDGVSERELYLESAFSDLREKYSRALLMETELQRALNVKNEECEELRRRDDNRSPETVAEIQKGEGLGEDGVSERELYLESAFSDLREKYSKALLKETELQRALNVKNEECEDLHRREQGLQRELSSVRGQLESTLQELRAVVDRGQQKTVAGLSNDTPNLSESTQIYKEDESVATQLLPDTSHSSGLDNDMMPKLSQSTQIRKEDGSEATQLLPETSNSLASCSASPNAGKDEFEITKVISENLSEMDNEEQGTQLLSHDLDRLPEAAVVANSQAASSADFRRVSVSGTTDPPPAATHGQASISPRTTQITIDRCPVRRLFVGGTETSEGCPKDEFTRQLPPSTGAVVAVLPPQTPGTALKSADEHDRGVKLEGKAAVAVLPPRTPGTALKFADEHERGVKLEGNGNANLGTLGTPGGGPTTPEKFAVLLGKGQEKGLICEMLDSFPPAQGIETQGGIDPFDHQFLESVPQTESNNLPLELKGPVIPMQDVRTLWSVPGVDDQKFGLDNERPALPNKPFEDINEETTLVEMWPKTTKRLPKYETTFDEMWPKTTKRMPRNVIVVSDSDDDEKPAAPPVSVKDEGDQILAEIGPNKKRRMNSASMSASIDDGLPVAAAAVPQPSEDDSDEEKKTLAELWRNKKRSRSPALVSDSQANETPAVPTKPSEDSNEEETLSEMGPKSKRRKNPVLVIDSDDDVDVAADDDFFHGARASTFSAGDSRKGTEDSSMSRTKLGDLDSGMGSHTSPHPAVNNCADPGRETSSSRNKSPSTPSITVSFGMGLGEENACGLSGRWGCRRELGRSGSVKSPDPVSEPLSGRDWMRDRKAFSPRSVNVILSSSDEEGGVCEGSRGSGSAGTKERRRRLVRVQESRDEAESLRPDPLPERKEETGAKASVRRSQRLRNVYASGSKGSPGSSEREEGRDSIEDTRGLDELGTSGDGSSSKPVVLDDEDAEEEEEEDGIEMDSDSSDFRPARRRPKPGNAKAPQSRRNPAVQRNLFGDKLDVNGDDEEDDIDTEDSFINDDPESDASDAEACSSDPVDEISQSGEESESDGSPEGGKSSSSAGRKKYNWELEGDMLAALAKDTDLCLSGICALFRRQEEDEKIDSSSKYLNKRGFSKFHAARASLYASFLMGEGDLSGPVVKTAEEFLEKFDEDAVTYCSDMCIHYSKQLFEIYENNEDRYFPEPYVDPLK